MAVYLIRHAETAANAARIVQTPEVPLSERGLEQARRLARRLRGERIGALLASDLRRARMTAEAVCDATGVALTLEPLLQERNFGNVRGTPYAELDRDLFALDYDPPGGESWERFHARVDRAWKRVAELAAETTEGPLVVVTHGLVCQSVVSRHARLEAGVLPHGFGWTNTSVTVLEGPPPWSVRLLNCTAHLDTGTGGRAGDAERVGGSV